MFRLLQIKQIQFLALPCFGIGQRCLGIFMLLLLAQISMAQAAEYKDPMQPPEYALKKYREAKNKNKPTSGNTVVKEKKEVKKLKLTSIIYSPTRKIAIIDDQMLSVGNSINGAKLVKIDKNGAQLVRKGKVINLHLPDDFTVIQKMIVESGT